MADLSHPHGDQPVYMAGAPLTDCRAALILLHGRGAGAHDILGLFEALGLEDVCALAPQAYNHTWYPHSFLAPIEDNQPYLDSALRKIADIVDSVIAAGVSPERLGLLGFSQGACLSCEFAARNPRRYGAIMALTGGVIGPPETEFHYSGSLDGTPVFLGTGNLDPHVPLSRVEETRDLFTAMQAHVELRVYPGRPHTVSPDELAACREILLTMGIGQL